MNMEYVKEFIGLIKSAEKINILTHYNPDTDALGAACALQALLRDNCGKDSVVVYEGRLPFAQAYLPADRVVAHASDAEIADLAIAVDTPTADRLGDRAERLFKRAARRAIIDHHPYDSLDADVKFIDAKTSSAAEILAGIAFASDWKITAAAAAALYAGIADDSEDFAWINGTGVYAIAARLVELGANPREIRPQLRTARRETIMTSARLILDTEFLSDGRIALCVVRNADYRMMDKMNLLMSELRAIDGVKVVAVLKEIKDDHIHVSLRSAEGVAINRVAESFGGGGHENAAAFTLHDNIGHARDIVMKALTEVL